MKKYELIFPELMFLEEYRGEFQLYFDAVYKIFETDFIKTQPNYEKKKVCVRKYPEENGIHRTFYHITHQGEDENNRTPDIRRMERIKFPRFVIENYLHDDILIWKNKRGADERVVLFNEKENYILILSQRKDYYLFITAYVIDKEHRKQKLLKEYKSYIKSQNRLVN
jgi:rlfB